MTKILTPTQTGIMIDLISQLVMFIAAKALSAADIKLVFEAISELLIERGANAEEVMTIADSCKEAVDLLQKNLNV